MTTIGGSEADGLGRALVDAAERVVVRDGVAGVSIVAVAAELGCSRVTLHRHGVTRLALLDAVAARASADLRQAVWPAVAGRGTAATRLVAALGTLCAVVERHRQVLAAFFVAADPPRRDRQGKRAGFDFIEPFERLLRDGIVDGSLRSPEPASDAELTVNAVTWTYLHLRTAHRWPKARARDRVVATVVVGLLTAPPR